MGLFSSKKSTTNQTANNANVASQLEGNAVGINLANAEAGNITVQTLDGGAVAGALETLENTHESNLELIAYQTDRSYDFATESLASADKAREDSLIFAGGAFTAALEESAHARSAIIGSFNNAMSFSAGAFQSSLASVNNATTNALNAAGSSYHNSLNRIDSANSSALAAIAAANADATQTIQTTTSDAINKVASATKSDSEKSTETIMKVAKWAAIAVVIISIASVWARKGK